MPKFSVVIPAYNGKEHLGEAIQSVLDQTYPDLEVIIVDDASPEDITPVINSFSDARVRYVRHEMNAGAVAARKTGVRESQGEMIAFLDQDDLFHKQKLETHLQYFQSNPDAGLTYNDRFEVIGVEKELCGIYRPPADLTLADWVLGFPVSPSDAVLKREWAVRDEIWDDSFARQAEHVIFNGQEIVFGGRLALDGCKFGGVGRALNYRRYHPYRVQKYLAERCQSELDCQEIIFSDPRCPDEVRALKSLASSNIYIMWAYTSFMQEEYQLGQKFLRQALELNPAYFMQGDPCPFLNAWLFWISAGTVDYLRSHEEIFKSVFSNLPEELHFLLNKYDWIVSQGYLVKGLHTMVWGDKEEAGAYLKTAFEKGAFLDDTSMNMMSDDLLNYEAEMGPEASQIILNQLSDRLSRLNKGAEARSLVGLYTLNRAFRNYGAGRFQTVPTDIRRAMTSDIKYMSNRGVLSILFRSLYYRFNS